MFKFIVSIWLCELKHFKEQHQIKYTLPYSATSDVPLHTFSANKDSGSRNIFCLSKTTVNFCKKPSMAVQSTSSFENKILLKLMLALTFVVMLVNSPSATGTAIFVLYTSFCSSSFHKISMFSYNLLLFEPWFCP